MSCHVTPLQQLKIEEWTRLQEEIAGRVRVERLFPIERIAGMDVSPSGKIVSMVTMSYPELAVLGYDYIRVEPLEDYIPFFLSFREMPGMQALFQRQQQRIDLVMVDGNGLLHPRRCGLATHFGVEEGIPTIGVSKNPVVYEGLQVDNEGVCRVGGEIVGQGLLPLTKSKKRIWVSVGHLCTLDQAVEIVRDCTRQHRIPEPIRLADHYGRLIEQTEEMKKEKCIPPTSQLE